jgi:hypothetical protein
VQREADLASQSHGEVHCLSTARPISTSDIEHTAEFRNRFNPPKLAAEESDDESDNELTDDELTDDELCAALKKGEFGSLTLGVERQILTEGGACTRWARFLDPRVLAMQWVLQEAHNIEAPDDETDETIELKIEPWVDGTTIGGHPIVASLLTFRPVDESIIAGDRYLRPRINIIADDTRETREIYELLVGIMMVQMRHASQREMKVKVSAHRTITVKLQIEAVRGDYHAQQVRNYSFVCCVSRACLGKSPFLSRACLGKRPS